MAVQRVCEISLLGEISLLKKKKKSQKKNVCWKKNVYLGDVELKVVGIDLCPQKKII